MNDQTISTKAAEVARLRAEKDETKATAELASSAFTKAANELLNMLEAAEMDSFTAHGFLFFTKEQASVKVPKDPEARDALFAFLKEKGIFDEVITVNSRTLNSLYNSLADEALTTGNIDFRMPGVSEPTPFKTLQLKKKD